MKVTRVIFITVALFALLLSSAEAQKKKARKTRDIATTGKLCLNNDGKISTRKKCKKNEETLDYSEMKGNAGTINIPMCIKREASLSSENTEAGKEFKVNLICPGGYFLFTSGYTLRRNQTNAIEDTAIAFSEPIFGTISKDANIANDQSAVPIGQSIISKGTKGFPADAFTIRASGVCCPL